MPLDLSNWMSLVNGSKLLSELSIPGTHDSGAKSPSSDAGRLTTQTRTIAEQLDDGIRFLDIRVGYTNNEFALYHEDVSLGLTFQDVLDTCSTFLTNHPRETIIMSLKKEDDAPASGNTRGVTFQDRFEKYVTDSPTGLFSRRNAIPPLRGSRGTIVLFRRYAVVARAGAPRQGINAYDDFPNDATGTIDGPPKLVIQDQFAQSGLNTRTRAEKWTAIKKLLNEASDPGNADVLYVNFASAAGIIHNDIDDDYPDAVAKDINPQLVDYFTDHPTGRFGIVVTDFETASLNRLIVETNPLDRT
jgi:1-phosphatidylinositol phosphodiesterase